MILGSSGKVAQHRVCARGQGRTTVKHSLNEVGLPPFHPASGDDNDNGNMTIRAGKQTDRL